jgi:methyltransferase-like protein
VVEFHTWQGDFVTEVSKRPAVSELAVYQARGGGHVVNQRHEVVPLDPVARQLVAVMNGSRNRGTLIRHLIERVSDGALTVHQDGNPVTDSAQIEGSLRAVMDQVLPKLARAALLIG